MNGAREVEALIGLASLAVAAACVFPGWLLGIPDSARRYGWRVACFISLGVWLFGMFAALEQRGWLDWLWVVCLGGYLITRIEANWRLLEAHRKLARLLPKRLPR